MVDEIEKKNESHTAMRCPNRLQLTLVCPGAENVFQLAERVMKILFHPFPGWNHINFIYIIVLNIKGL